MDNLTSREKTFLLQFARQTIEEYLGSGRYKALPDVKGALEEHAGAFVTLHTKDGNLRGCIGNMIGRGPLIETIRDMAIAASTSDPRFSGVTLAELTGLELEISVLSPMIEVKKISEIEVGKHGLMIRKGYMSGVLLPQVATEYGWDTRTFLENLCYKAGLPPDAWKEKGVVIESFTAEVFNEKDYK